MGKRRLPAELDQRNKAIGLVLRVGGRLVFSFDTDD